MSDPLMLLIPIAVLAIVLLFPFVGCVGVDPDVHEQTEKERDEARGKVGDLEKQIADDKKQDEDDKAAAAEAAKYQNVVLAEPDLVCYWRLNEPDSASPQAIDSAPDEPKPGAYMLVQGLLHGQAGPLSPKNAPNAAVEFLGTEGYVEVNYHPLLNPPEDFTIELWVRPPVPPEPVVEPQVVVGSYELNPMGQMIRGYLLELLPGTPQMIGGRVGSGTGATTIAAALPQPGLVDGWHHVVMTYSGKADKRLRLYVDAADAKFDKEVSPATGTPVEYEANVSMPLRIGAGQPEGPGLSPAVAGLFFKGRIDEVALYRVALEGAAVQKHFQSALSV